MQKGTDYLLKNRLNELLSAFYVREVLKSVRWGICLIPLFAILLTVILSQTNASGLLEKDLHETIAIWLTGAAFALTIVRYFVHRADFYKIMIFLTGALLFREIHIDDTGELVYLNVIIAAVWMALWRKRIRGEMTTPAISSGFVGTWMSYVIALLIARRAFAFIPGEDALHIALEEMLETTGHVFLVMTFMMPAWDRSKSSAESPAPEPSRLQ